ncbi:hypothetical protein BC835DRAFT_1423338 [Cytidiella melzeri]|nr:hypothetical protein BC835DRAFT_1423338 [Cytidiella melzeri]
MAASNKNTSTRTPTSNARSEDGTAMDGRELNKASSRLRMDGSSEDTRSYLARNLTTRAQTNASARKSQVTETELAEKWGLCQKTVVREGIRVTWGSTAKALANANETELNNNHDAPLVTREPGHGSPTLSRYNPSRAESTGLSTPTIEPLSTELSETTTDSPPLNSDEEDTVEEMLSSMTIYDAATKEVKNEPEDESWIQPRQTTVNTVIMNEQLASALKHVNWFNLLDVEDTDPYGSIPESWNFLLPKLPVLPVIKPEDLWQDCEMAPSEKLEGFVPAYTDEDEARMLQIAKRRSIHTNSLTKTRKGKPLYQRRPVQCMATVVEVEDTPEPPEGEVQQLPSTSLLTEPQYSAQEKGKGVDRDPEQTEFLRRYASCEPEAHKTKEHSKRSHAHSRSRHQAEGVKFQREESIVPEGGWFHSKRASHTPVEPYDGSSSESSSSSSTSLSSSSSLSSTVSVRRQRDNAKSRTRWQTNQKQIRRAMRGVKINTPELWNGKADFDRFDKFTYKFDNWIELSAVTLSHASN